MITLNEILTEKPAPSSDAAYIQHAVACSPFLARLLNKDATLLADLLQKLHQPYTLAEMQTFINTKISEKNSHIFDEIVLKKVLRQLRQSVMARMIVRDLNALADGDSDNLSEVMQTTSHLAEVCLQFAVEHLMAWQIEIHGVPMDASGHRQDLIIVGMGKLGGYELNVSSDIDLIFAYEEEGATNADVPISNQEFFTRLAKRLIPIIDDVTEDGFVFRVDMRLRPYGSEGVMVSSLDALEDYYQNNGREWERYAWIKGRVVVGHHEKLAKLLKPFVFRKYLDFGAFASMRDLKVQIQRDVVQRSLQNNIKLGRGGIREIEFIAQVFQLIRGGQDASLQIRPTLSVLKLLKNKGLLKENVVNELSEAYVFLRNLEHRLMYVEDQQTQDLPKSDAAKARIALAMNFADWTSFYAQLEVYRKAVQHCFDEVFQDGSTPIHINQPAHHASIKELWQGVVVDNEAETVLATIGYAVPKETLRRLKALHTSARYQQLPVLSRQRFDALMPSMITLAAKETNPDVTLLRMLDLIESICRRASYLALLAEFPTALGLVAKLVSTSPWLANYLSQHPILLDELLDSNSLYATPDFDELRTELQLRLNETNGDVERQMDAIRHFKSAATFRFAAKDVAGDLALETLSDYLSELADLILDISLTTVWQNLKIKHIDVPKFAVIGYGKLGGMELGYASDLDIIFLYDDDTPEASDIYARFAQRINNWFNSLTSAGLLYETDLQLRPDGNSGLLVSSVAAFREYQLKKAWVWEHQAITRARFVAGDASIGKAFDQIRIEVITQPRDLEKLRAEVLSMRHKMRAANPDKADLFDLKHSHGGIIDVEFLVQFLVLKYAAKYSQLTENIGNIALLKRCGELGIIEMGLANTVADAYRDYRRLQHSIRLQGISQARVELSQVESQRLAVIELWHQVLRP